MKAITRAVDEALDEWYAKGYNDGLEAACNTDNRTLCKCVSEDKENQEEPEGYDAGFFNGREVALEKAQEAINRIFEAPTFGGAGINELVEIFDTYIPNEIFTDFSLREIISKFYAKDTDIHEEELIKNISKEEARDLILDEVRDLGYKEGLEKAWEAARRIVLNQKDGGLPTNEFHELFGSKTGWYNILQGGMTVYDVIEALDKYDERNEIHVGDEVILDNNGEKAVVTEICTNTLYVNVMYSDGCTRCRTINSIEKTGNHFAEVSKMLEALRGGEAE